MYRGPQRGERLGLSAVILFFKEFHLANVITIPQRHRQTDGQIDGRTDSGKYRALRSIAR